jgi:hypothetical protein
MPRSFDDHFGRIHLPQSPIGLDANYLFLGASSTFGGSSPWTCSILYFGYRDARSSSKDTLLHEQSAEMVLNIYYGGGFLDTRERHKMDHNTRE